MPHLADESKRVLRVVTQLNRLDLRQSRITPPGPLEDAPDVSGAGEAEGAPARCWLWQVPVPARASRPTVNHGFARNSC